MDKVSLLANETFPHVPAGCNIKPDRACAGCPQSATAGHGTVSEIAPGGAVTADNKFDASIVMGWQWMLHRMQIDCDGVPGSYNDTYSDAWKLYNARGSYNFADAYSYTVVSVSGNQITCESTEDPREITLFSYFRPDGTGIKRVTGYFKPGSPQPGDVMQFSGNSKISLTCWPIITRVLSVDVGAKRIVFETDKVMTAALSKYDIYNESTEEWEADTSDVTVKCWQHEGNRATWRPIIKPELFFGKQKTVTILADTVLAAADNIYTLSADTAVMHPGGFDPLHPVWTLTGRRIDTNEWESISDANSRLYVLPNGPSVVALGDVKPATGDTAPGSDLTVTYNAFKATYWVKTDGSGSNCSAVGYARCKWSVPEPTSSVGNMGAAAGTAIDENGVHYVCLKAKILEEADFTVTDENSDGFDDTATANPRAPTGLSRYVPHCLQHGSCNESTPAEDHGDGTPFAIYKHGGHVLRELWGSCNYKLVRLYPRDQSRAAFQAQRVNHPSLCWHAGYVALATPNVIDYGEEVSFFRGGGLWGTGYYTYTDGDNTYLALQQGPFDGFRVDDPDADNAGAFAGLGATRDQVTPGTTNSQREIERIGVAVERDSGALQDRGISQSSVAVTAQDVVIPAIDLSITDSEQYRAQGSFEFDVEGNGVLRVLALRQASKNPVLIGSRELHSVTSLGGGKSRIELENGQHTFSYISAVSNPGAADNYDYKATWNGGGCWPIMPKAWQRIRSHYEPNNYAGSRANGAWRGDAIAVGDRNFLIDAVVPHGGSEPTGTGEWGDTTYKKYGYGIAVVWMPSLSNTALGTTPDETYGPVSITSVKYDGTGTPLTLIDSVPRPATISTGEYWFGEGALFVSSGDATQYLRIDYTVVGKDVDENDVDDPFTEYVTVPSDFTLPTDVLVSDWTSADATLVLVAGVAPATGYSVDTSGTYVEYTFAMADAGKGVEIILTFNTPAPAPDDLWNIGYGGLLDYGKKRDYVDVYDDADGFVAALTAGDTIDFYSAAAVTAPGWTLQFTDYATDAWADVDGAIVHHGTGEAIIPATWFAERTGMVCFRAHSCVLMDHRGIVPASLFNKTDAAVRGLTHVVCNTFGGRGGYSYNKSFEQTAYLDGESVVAGSIVEGTVGVSGNYYYRASGFLAPVTPPHPGGEAYTNVALKVESTSFGIALPLAFIPDGCTIISAKAEISGGSITRAYGYSKLGTYPCVGSGRTPVSIYETSISDISYSFIGLNDNGTGYTELAEVPGAANGQIVADVTDIISIMYENRALATYASYGFIAIPTGAGTSSTELQPIPDLETIPVCSSGIENQETGWTEGSSVELTWGSISMFNIVIEFTYPSGEYGRKIIQERWPSLAPVA